MIINGNAPRVVKGALGLLTCASTVRFEYASESDGRRYPLPRRVPVGGRPWLGRRSPRDRGGPLTLPAVRAVRGLAAAGRSALERGLGAIWNLRSNRLRPRGWTSADAAGLPILPGLARYDEVRRGRIDHALRFTAARIGRAFVYPARHFASELTDPSLPAMGQRLRLRRGFDINGSSWFLSGAPNPGWVGDDLHSLHRVPGRAFEAVDSSRLPRP